MSLGIYRESDAMQRDDGVWIVPRAEFCDRRFTYKRGEHVCFAGPTQNGKTQLAFDLLEHIATADSPVYVAVSKPRDPVTSRYAEQLGYRTITSWPPSPRVRDIFRDQRPAGIVVWPDMSSSENAIENASGTTRQLIHDTYAAGAKGKTCILMLDDTVTKSKIMGLDHDIVMVLTMSGAMGIGGWCFVQKPTGAGNAALWSFSQSSHVFIARDPDKRNRERYTEIGGFDSKEVERVSLTLERYQFLYLEREHRYMCIVDKD